MHDPVHQGSLPDATHVGAVGNPACGDVVTFHLRVREGRIEAASFESIGSAYQLATASVLCDCVTGQDVEAALARGPDCVLKRLPDLPERQRYLARLAIDALQRALTGRSRPREQKEQALQRLEEADAQAFVLRVLGRGEPLRTQQVQALAEAEGVALPGSTLRSLAGLRRAGVIAGEMDVAAKTWRWRLPE